MVATGGTNITLFGNDGNDSMIAAGGTNITIFGGAGDDTMLAQAGTSITMFGNDGDDSLSVSVSDVIALGGTGNDTLMATAGTDITMFGNEGNDSMIAAAGSRVTMLGDDGNDTLQALSGSQIILFGGTGDDSITSSSTGDQITIFGGDGNDTMLASAGTNVTMFGDAGDDSITVAGGTNVTVFGGDGNDTMLATAGTNVTMFGEAGDDSLTANGGENVSLYGGDGNDTLQANGGDNVTLFGELGNDSLTIAGGNAAIMFGGGGDDTLTASGSGDVSAFGDDGNDTYVLTSTGGSVVVRLKELLFLDTSTTPDGTRGTDTIDLSQFGSATLALDDFGSNEDPTAGLQDIGNSRELALYGQFDNIIGTPGNDLLTGNDGDNKLIGNGGNDTLVGEAGDDTLVAGIGNDSLVGGTGNDTYQFTGASVGNDTIAESASADSDTLDFSQFNAPVSVDLSSTAPQALNGGQVVLTLSDPTGVENVVGSAFNDSLTGNARDNVLEGGAGDDTLAGGAGDDIYVFAGGNLGKDTIVEAPNTGSDTLDFSRFNAAVNVDLANPNDQTVSAGNLTLNLGNSTAVENVVGSTFNDTILGNASPNDIYGAGGVDYIDGRGGNDYLQGDVTQVVLLDFDSRTDPGEHVYTPDERAAIQAQLETDYSAFSYVFTQDLATAEALAKPEGGQFATLYFNDGSSSDGGGNSSQLDFGNTDLGGFSLIDVNGFLGGDGEPAATSANFVALSSDVAAHELGHLSGLHHADSFGPIGSGIYAGVDPSVYLAPGPGPDLFTNAQLGVQYHNDRNLDRS